MSAEKIEVGRFSFDPATSEVTGPAAYMRERGNERLRSIEAGTDVVFNMGVIHSPSIEVAILVSLQTDFAGWRGQKQMESRVGAGVTW